MSWSEPTANRVRDALRAWDEKGGAAKAAAVVEAVRTLMAEVDGPPSRDEVITALGAVSAATGVMTESLRRVEATGGEHGRFIGFCENEDDSFDEVLAWHPLVANVVQVWKPAYRVYVVDRRDHTVWRRDPVGDTVAEWVKVGA